LHESIDVLPVDEPTYRVAFERDDGQEYGVGVRVAVHDMNSGFRTVVLSPTSGDYRVTRCERIRDAGWKALRISLERIVRPASDGVASARVTDARR
jgi:hypothetical protein